MDINRLLEGFLGSHAGSNRGNVGMSRDQRPGQLGDMLNSGLAGNLPGGLAGGAAAGGLIALLLGSKKVRKVGGKALTYGGLAVVGALAYKAWNDYKANRPSGPASLEQLPAPPPGSAFDLESPSDGQGSELRLALVRAMISASNADGHIDQSEHARIQQQIQSMDLAADEKAFLFDQLNSASDPVAIARLAQGEEQGAEIYLASALAIDPDTPQEQRYLERLGDALHLPEALRQQLDKHAAAARES